MSKTLYVTFRKKQQRFFFYCHPEHLSEGSLHYKIHMWDFVSNDKISHCVRDDKVG